MEIIKCLISFRLFTSEDPDSPARLHLHDGHDRSFSLEKPHDSQGGSGQRSGKNSPEMTRINEGQRF